MIQAAKFGAGVYEGTKVYEGAKKKRVIIVDQGGYEDMEKYGNSMRKKERTKSG